MVKGPGMWTETEDRLVRLCAKTGFSPSETANRLNRLESSVKTRAAVLKVSFQVSK